MKFLRQSILLICSFALIFAWQNSPLANYTIIALGFLIFMYLFVSVRKKKFNPFDMEKESLSSIFILNTVIFLLIFTTGALASPLFFLLYFLGFGLVFVFEPAIVFIFAIGTVLIFLQLIIKDDIVGNLVKVGLLCLTSPLAFFFGKEFIEKDKDLQKIKKTK